MMTATKPITYTGSGSAIDNYKSAKPQSNENWGLFKKNNQQHRTILSLLRQAQWTTEHDTFGEVADLERFSNWLKSEKAPVRKPLLEMTEKEVSKTIVALTGIVNHKYK
ncbi:MAG: hypothetical protein ITG00_03345 [Flavobacterium sp.]|nr:hypothetical protein [Flavobacterium sp.]